MNEFGISHLVDVRSVPSSEYWTDFRREILIDKAPAAGFKSVYMGDTPRGVEDSPALGQNPESVD